MAKRIIKPNVVSGGVAIPLGNNFYYMKGRKHKNGGIDIGSNPKTGIEVEDGEVMQMMQNGAKVFSSMPFLRGSSPANKVLAGENPDNVFRQQELYKDRNNINDDGTKKKAVGGIAYRNATRNAFGDNYPYGIYPLSLDYMFPGDEVTSNEQRFAAKFIPKGEFKDKKGNIHLYPAIINSGVTKDTAKDFDEHKIIGWFLNNNRMAQNLYRHRLDDAGIKSNIPDKINPYEDRGIPYVNKNGNVEYLQPEEAKAIRYTINKDTNYTSSNKFSNFFKNKDNLSDTIGIGSNILGSTLSYFANKRMLNNMKEPIKPKIVAPVNYQATKLKTNVNINPQLDTLRNSSAIYNNSVDNNTSSSRVALARKQANRLNINNQINTLYGNKENQETELINRDRLQQQQTANQNIAQYNDYLTRKAAIDNEYNNQLINFNNTINEKKGENLVSLFNNSNAAIQDILNRREQRNNERNTIAAYLASNPNVNPRLFTRLGIDGVFTPEMIQAWEEEYKNNKNKTKTN